MSVVEFIGRQTTDVKLQKKLLECTVAACAIPLEIADLLFDGVLSVGDVGLLVVRIVAVRVQMEGLITKYGLCHINSVAVKTCAYAMIARYIPSGFDGAFEEAFSACWFLLEAVPTKVQTGCAC